MPVSSPATTACHACAANTSRTARGQAARAAAGRSSPSTDTWTPPHRHRGRRSCDRPDPAAEHLSRHRCRHPFRHARGRGRDCRLRGQGHHRRAALGCGRAQEGGRRVVAKIKAFFKLDLYFFENPKTVDLSHAATVLYIASIAHANRRETDGFVHRKVLRRLVDLNPTLEYEPTHTELAQELVKAGLWEPA